MMCRLLGGPILIAVIATASIAACTSSTPTAASSPTAPLSATAGTTAPPPPSASPSASPSARPSARPKIFTTPTSAAQHLYAAWKANDRTAAALGASQATIHALFTRRWTSGTYFFGGCSTHTECDYNFSTGAIRMTLAGSATTGYKVTAIAFGNAG